MIRLPVLSIAARAATLLFGGMVAGLPSQAAVPTAPAGCEPEGALHYICGPVNAEDLIRLGDRWVVASGMDGPLNGGAPARGRLYLIDHAAKSWTEWFPGESPQFRQDQTLFGQCPGPVDISSFSAHGLALQERGGNRYRIYVTGHGAREAIEVFDVDATSARPAVAWVGCVVLPADVSANSVAILPDGGFVTTKFLDRRLPVGEAFQMVARGEINGAVYEWRPGGEVKMLAGTELSGPNGIAVSPDGNSIFVAAFGSHELVRFRREGQSLRRDAVKLDIGPDNLRWTDTGTLLTTGSNQASPGTPPGWSVVEIDTQTLAAQRVTGGGRLTGMQGVSVALRVGEEIWVGTYSGNRIVYLASP